LFECKTLGDKTLRVPTFYSPYNNGDDNDGLPYLFSMCVATVFGAIHCIPWSFHFATLQEQWAWRISSVLLSGVPISALSLGSLLSDSENEQTELKLYDYFLVLIIVILVSLYSIARIVLLVLPFVALRALPPGAYVQVNWISFLPHI